jgi:tripartite ATP-independent transporter DctM subunit
VKALANAVLRTEQGILVAALALATVLPLIDVVGRPLGGFHLTGTALYVTHLTLWLTFVGGLAAATQQKHLTLSTSAFLGEGTWQVVARFFSYSISAIVLGVLSYASAQVVKVNALEQKVLPIGLPEWASESIMPVALGLMAVIFAWKSSERWWGRAIALALIPSAFALQWLSAEQAAKAWPLTLLILLAALFGAPVFVAMGGVALVLFFHEGTPVSAVSAEVYRLVASPTLPAIPLLTAAGYILGESNAAERLVRFFRALFGWMPGGIAVMVACVCAVFTTFTGGSGVTIIALGGLVYPILRKDGYSESFSLGLVTAAGSLGLLFPPSLPVILYSVVASNRNQTVAAGDLYLAGLVPGLLLVALTAFYGILIGRRRRDRQTVRFSWHEVCQSGWKAKWELLLPVFIITIFATGLTTMVETAAAALAYTVIVECAVTRDVSPFKQLPEVLVKASALMGAVLTLLSIAMGLTNYLVDAQIPDQLLAWVQVHIHSQVIFLLALNAILLLLGSVLEIYSAIIVLAPLIVPIGAAFKVDPIHLGIIFLANLELGFLFPPVGLNLFLSSSRFGRPLTSLYRHVIPFLVIIGIGVLLITYVDSMSLGVLKLLGKHP